MAKSLGSFRAALLIGWGVLGLAGFLYARSRGIPESTAWPAVAAFLIEYSFYLVPAFPPLRERINGTGLVYFALAASILPYLACCSGAVAFQWSGLGRLAVLAVLLALWFRVLPRSAVVDVAYLALVGAVLLGAFFNPIYASRYPQYRDLKNLVVIPHLSLIAISVMALMVVRRVPEVGYGFLPNRREWRIGLVHAGYFLVAGLPLALLLHATHLAKPKPVWYIGATFIGMLCVASLSEEFFIRGVLLGWMERWTGNGQSALLLTSAIFGLLHLKLGVFPNWKWAILAGLLGWFCGRARNQAGSIRASMVTHALVATTWRAFFA